ncbi:Rab-protein geranylgeranyltransferase [Mycena sanguinolenta]|uniref:Geranylgeranyl transferase type-2 subunit alpha n=1 Tax=Mycena sanguinolenta TaxID=230812 RepID=A0A8H6YHS9_9AGAR|nr:Rab-protein geranylgeranyltransferase [Mycena sanguinolenta]
MHGVKRVRETPEAAAAKKLREQSKIKEYLALNDDVLAKHPTIGLAGALDLTTRILQINPEFYTVWNYRRNILLQGIFPERPVEVILNKLAPNLHLTGSSPKEINDLLTDDLSMTTVALKMHPKVYWIWNHRRWCLENVPDGPGTSTEGDVNGWRKINWDKEMYVVDKMLEADSRNFHAWSYRRYVLARMPVARPEAAELAYTTRKIESNFSNFSAWHQRTKILTSLWGSGTLDYSKSKEKGKSCVFWDDKDVLDREISIIQELLDEQSDRCMESLVHYKQLLLKNHASSVDAASLTNDCRCLLADLRVLDPARRRRYEEIGEWGAVVEEY